MSEYAWDPSRPFVPSEHPAATEMGRDICVSAGAGCGKTSLLVARAVNLVEREGVALERILAITFTEKAANQMKRRIIEEFEKRGWWGRWQAVEDAPISTIHSFCAWLLRENAFAAGVDPDFGVLDEHQSALLLWSSLDEVLEEAFASEAREDMFRLTMALAEERQLKEALLFTYKKVRSLGLPFSELNTLSRPAGPGGSQDAEFSLARSGGPADAYHEFLAQRFIWLLERLEERYQAKKETLFGLDFEDLQLRARELLNERSLREECRRRFLQVLVDEFQDVNPLQDAIIERVASKGNLFIVGDVKQSIYRFRHAEVGLFRRRMEEAREREDAWRMALQLNYRSRREILAFVNCVFSGAWQDEPLPYEELYFGAPLADAPPGPRVKILLLPGREEIRSAEQARPLEASFLAGMIRETVEQGALQVCDSRLHSLRPLRYGDIFMLFRSASDINLYERALALERVPYYSVSSRGFFQRSEIQDTIAFLKAIDDPYDDLALASVLRSPWVGITDATLVRVAERAEGQPLLQGLDAVAQDSSLPNAESRRLADFRNYLTGIMQVRNRLAPGDLVRRIVRDNFFEARLLAQLDGRRRVANLRKFCRLVDELGSAALGLSDLLHHVEELSVVPVREGEAPLEPEGADVVTLMTWHAAKGLEKEMVILPDLSRRPPSRLPRALVDQKGSLGLNFVPPASGSESARADEPWPPVEEQRQAERQAEREEEKRMLYVAMTRAKEFLILSGLRAEEMTCCGVQLKDTIDGAPPGVVEVENVPAGSLGRARDGGATDCQ